MKPDSQAESRPSRPPKEKRERRRVTYPDPRQFERRPEQEPVAGGETVPVPKPGKWSRAIDEWVARREKERERDRKRDECGRDRRKVPMPRPYLDATSNFGPQITALRVGEAGSVSFTVWNDGNYPAWTCYVDLYEGPGGYTSPLAAYALRGRRIIALHPGERREVALPWVRQQTTGRIVGVVYDPLLDPRDFTVVEQVNRHITSVHYLNLE
jgi:hypothetical protein